MIISSSKGKHIFINNALRLTINDSPKSSFKQWVLEMFLWRFPAMQKVHLLFPNISSLAAFVITHKIRQAEVNSSEHRLTAPLSEEELRIATKQYGAEPRTARLVSLGH